MFLIEAPDPPYINITELSPLQSILVTLLWEGITLPFFGSRYLYSAQVMPSG